MTSRGTRAAPSVHCSCTWSGCLGRSKRPKGPNADAQAWRLPIITERDEHSRPLSEEPGARPANRRRVRVGFGHGLAAIMNDPTGGRGCPTCHRLQRRHQDGPQRGGSWRQTSGSPCPSRNPSVRPQRRKWTRQAALMRISQVGACRGGRMPVTSEPPPGSRMRHDAESNTCSPVSVAASCLPARVMDIRNIQGLPSQHPLRLFCGWRFRQRRLQMVLGPDKISMLPGQRDQVMSSIPSFGK